ncbi:MAG: carboxypeptidase regulatory-like domain-containing protein, partial [Blastocatellia bacterium]|nr:carboxypeptidase regulatory-like domain-containing protein [Blastocatellia bacterium]
VTSNDVGDVDTGANDLQNFPFIDIVASGSTRVIGRFFSTPNRTFRLEFFNNPTVDTSGYGEGQIYIGAINVITDANGRADFDNTFTYNSPIGSYVTSTATDLTTLNTSEFSFAVRVQGTTAATVSVSGRVTTAQGRGIRSVVVTMTDSNGNTRIARTTSFGYYRFEEVAAGETYIFMVTGKRLSFGQNTQVHSIMEDTNNINFVASEQSVFSVN